MTYPYNPPEQQPPDQQPPVPPDPASQPPAPPVNLGDNGESAALVQQALNAAGGFDYGSDRAIGSPPNWAAHESEQLYLAATGNNDPASAEATGQEWRRHGEELHQAATDLYNAIAELGNVWIGHGAAAAQGTLIGIAKSSRQAGDAAHTMASRMEQQAAAAAEVKKMPKPKTFDPAQATAAMLAGGPAAMVADLKRYADEARAVHAQQVQYFKAYTQAMSDVDQTTPSFGPESLGLPRDGNISSTSAASVGGTSGLGITASVGPVNAVATGLAGAGAGGRGFAGSDAGGFAGPPVGSPSGALPGAYSSSAAAAAAGGPSSGGRGGAGALGAGLGLAGGGLGAAAGKAVLGKGNKTGAKNRNATGAASTEHAEQHGHAVVQNQSLMNNSGTIGGTHAPPPATGMAGAGAGAQSEEDKEHTRASFLIETDPDSVFGADVAIAPPVIGAWGDDYEN